MVETSHANRPLWRADKARRPRWPRQRALANSRIVVLLGLHAWLLTAALLGGRRYIDPGSGSFAIQIIIAAVLGGILSVRLWLRHLFWRIIGHRRRTKSDPQRSSEDRAP